LTTARAAHLLSKALTVLKKVGARFSWTEELDQKTVTTIRTDLDGAAFVEAWDQGQAMTIDAAVALALESSA